MGNCFRSESSSMVWAGDDWGSIAPKKRHDTMFQEADDNSFNIEKQRLLDMKRASSSTREVKIKITKKELEEMMGKVKMQELSAEQVLARLINASDGYEMERQRSWRPALQSIPEVN